MIALRRAQRRNGRARTAAAGRSVLYWALALAGAFDTPAVRAISPDLELNQLGHTAWRVQDGVLPGSPTTVAQAGDGYIWIGTQAGLVRFDGITFVPITPPREQTPRFTRITALYSARDGSLWIGTSSQLLRLKDGHFHLYDRPVGVYEAIREGPDGRIWATRHHTPDDLGSLCEVRERTVSCYGAKHGIPFKDAITLAIEKSGAIWLAAPSKLARWQGGQSQIFAPAELSRVEGLDGFRSVVVAPDGSIWSGVIHGGPGLGLQHFANGTWKPATRGELDTSNWQVTAVLFDRDNTLWVGTANRGIYRIGPSKIDHFGVGDGLSADAVNAFCEDREGNIWAVTTMGVDKFRPMQVITVSSRQGLSADEVDAVVASRSGAIWISNANALDRINNGTVKSYRQSDGLPGESPTALLEDSRGRLWVGVDDGIALFENERFRRIASPTPPGPILQFAESPDSTVWGLTATLPSRLLRLNSAEIAESISPPAGYRFSALAAATDGSLWFALSSHASVNCDLARYTNGHWEIFPLHNPAYTGQCRELALADGPTVLVAESNGLDIWHDGVVRKLGVEDGLPCVNAYGTVLDTRGDLWLSLQCGLAVVESQQLLNWWKSPIRKPRFRLLDSSDGVLTGPAEFHPRVSVGIDGKVWFANSIDLQFVDPKHWIRNPVIAPVHIQTLQGDGRIYGLTSPIALPPLTRNIQIDFTAPSFVIPQRVQFRYKLDGWDTEWQRPLGRRQALYSNLRPGKYRFAVVASNDDGLWNVKGDSLEFVIAPAYYQNWWFRLLCAAGILMLLQAAYAYRLRLAKVEIQKRLAARLSERERIARDLHDTLLQSVQGLLFKFGAVADAAPSDSAVRNKLEGLLTQADDVMAEGRARVRGLRGENDVAVNLTEQLGAHGSGRPQSSAAFDVTIVGHPLALNPIAADEVLNIAREAINNSFKHAEARHIEVEITYDTKAFGLKVRDDGKGMEQGIADLGRAGHWGIVGMRERAKSLGTKLTVWSRLGSGTEIELTVPAATAYAITGASAQRGFIERVLNAVGFRRRRPRPSSPPV
jgi:signal transduction histidine kinase/ligand-binding sensor domain-containing protein